MRRDAWRGLLLVCGFGAAKAVMSNAYVSAFGSDARSSMGFVSSTSFVLAANVLSVLVALAVVLASVRGARAHGTRSQGLPRLAAAACAVLAAGYVLGAGGMLAALPAAGSGLLTAALYALGSVVLTAAWIVPFVAEPDVRRAMRRLVAGYLVQALAFFALSLLAPAPQAWACCGLLAASGAAYALVCGCLAPAPATAPVPAPVAGRGLREALRSLVSPLACVLLLTAVVGLLHTSVIGGTFERVVGAVPMAEALGLATALVAVVVLAGSRVPDPAGVFRALFPVMLVALSLLPFVSEALGPVSGMIMVVCYDMVGIAFVLLLVETARAYPAAPAPALVGTYLAGTQLFLVAGLGLGLALNHLGSSAPAASFATVLMLACIYLLSAALMVLLRRRRATGSPARAASGEPAGEAEGRTTLFGARPFGRAAQAPGEEAAPTREPAADERAEQREVRERVGVRVEAFARERGLTPRESQVLVQLARGRSATAIAADLGITENTAWAHIKRVYAKMGVHGKQELIDVVEREVIERRPGE